MENSKFIVYSPEVASQIKSSANLRNFIVQNSLKVLPFLHFIRVEDIQEVNIKFPK